VGKWAGVKHHVAGGHGRDIGFWDLDSLCVGFAAVSPLFSAMCSSVWCFRHLKEGLWVACWKRGSIVLWNDVSTACLAPQFQYWQQTYQLA
jgi:hypothetical protein